MSKSSGSFGFIIFLIIFFVSIGASQCERCSRRRGSNTYSATTHSNSSTSSLYQLKFSDNFKKGLALQSELGMSILIAVDCSGSMDDPPANSVGKSKKKYVVASESVTNIISFLKNFYENNASKSGLVLKLGLIKFSSNAVVMSDLLKMNSSNFTRLKQITSNPENFRPNGATAIGKTLELGTEMLAQSGTIFKSLIIITDGENTEGIEPAKVLSAIVGNENNVTTTDFPIYTDDVLVSFVGFDIDQSVFENLHEIGARVTSAGNRVELEKVLKNIFLTDITQLESN